VRGSRAHRAPHRYEADDPTGAGRLGRAPCAMPVGASPGGRLCRAGAAATLPARSIIFAKPAVVNGAPRSLTNTNGEVTLSRCSRRSARISSPRNGCVVGVLFFAGLTPA
jgi:hypothetical protein